MLYYIYIYAYDISNIIQKQPGWVRRTPKTNPWDLRGGFSHWEIQWNYIGMKAFI